MMRDPCVVVPPSPNWYGAHLAAEHPHEPLVAYAGHDAAVIVRCGGKSGNGGDSNGEESGTSIVRCLAPHPARVSSLVFAPAPEGEDDQGATGENGGDEHGCGSSGGGGGGGGGGDGSDAAATTATAATASQQSSSSHPLLVCGCEDGTAVCWDTRRGVRTRAARRYRSALSAVVAVTMATAGGAAAAAAAATATAAQPTKPPLSSFAIFGDSSGRLLAWSYGTGERSKPAPLAAKLPDHGGIVCLCLCAAPAAAPQPQPQPPTATPTTTLLLFAGCRDGTVACVELRPHEEGDEHGSEAPCASSVRFVFSPHDCAGGRPARQTGATATSTTTAAVAAAAQRGRKTPASSSSSSSSAMPPAAVQELECFEGADGELLLLTGTAAGGLALWDARDERFSALPRGGPRPLARASLPRPPTGPGGGGGGGQAPWTAARVVPRSLRQDDDGDCDGNGLTCSCVVAAGAPGGALVLQPMRWRQRRRRQAAAATPEAAAAAPPPPPAPPAAAPLARTRAAHSRPVFAVCFPGRGENGAILLATISMDRCLVLSRVLVGVEGVEGRQQGAGLGAAVGGPPPPPLPPPPSSSSSSAATTTAAAAIQPFWRSQGLGGYAYAMDARAGALAIACGDRTLRLLALGRRGWRRRASKDDEEGGAGAAAAPASAAAVTAGEPELVWSGATSKPLCCAWRPGGGSSSGGGPPPLAWGDADGRVGTLGGGGGGGAGALRLEPFPHARHGGPALQLSWSPGAIPTLYSLGGEGCLLRWPAPAPEATAAAAAAGSAAASAAAAPTGGGRGAAASAAAAAIAAVVGPGPPVDVSPSLHAALLRALAVAGSGAAGPASSPSPARQWTAAAWHPRLPLLAAAADDGAVAVFSPPPLTRRAVEAVSTTTGIGAAGTSAHNGAHGADQEEEDDDDEDKGQPTAAAGPRWRVVGFCASSRRGRVRRLAWAGGGGRVEDDAAAAPLLLLAAVHARDLAVFAMEPHANANAPELRAHVVRASASAAASAAGALPPGPAQGGGGGGDAGDEAMDAAWLPAAGAGGDPDPLLVVGLGNGHLRAWRVRAGQAAGRGGPFSPLPPSPLLFLVPTASAAAGAAGLPAHADAVQSLAPLAFPGDGPEDEPLLLSGSRDQSVRVWRARDFGPLAGAGDASAAAAAADEGDDGEAAAAAIPHRGAPAAGAGAAAPGPVSQRHWRRLLPAGKKQAMPEPPPARTPQERAACLAAVLALARAVLPLPGEEEQEAASGGDDKEQQQQQQARLLALMVADADAVAADPELRRDMSAERRAALAVWRGDVRGALSAAGGAGGAAGAAASLPPPPPIAADGAVVAAAAGGAAWRAASAALAMAADASGQPCTAAVHRRAAGLAPLLSREQEGEREEEEGGGGGGGGGEAR